MSPASTQRLGGGARFWLARFCMVLLMVLCGGLLLSAQPPGGAAQEVAGGIMVFIIAFGVLLIASGVVSSTETALFSLDKLDVSLMRSSEGWLDRLVLRFLDRPNETLITILILNNIVNISVSLTAGAMTDRMLGRASPVAFMAAAVLATGGILMFGEILPKMLAHMNPLRSSRILVIPLSLGGWVITPLRITIRASMHGLFRMFKIPEASVDEEISEEELKAMISSGEISQVLEEDEREMIDGVFELRRTSVDEILTPRLSVTAMPDDLSDEEMIARLRASPNSRVLVYRESLDHLVGFLLVKEVLLNPERPWREHVREAVCVPERLGLLDLLKLFRRRRTKMAVVVDEYGGVEGIVTLQDLLEEIVGDIWEPHEHSQHELVELPGDRWRVAGGMNLEELGKHLDVEFPAELGRTAGGFVMNTLGRIPRAGDEVAHKALRLRVKEMVGRRVHVLEISRDRDAESDDKARGNGEARE